MDEFPSFDACEKDDQFNFRTDNTYEINEKATKFEPLDPKIINSGSWTFKNNETILSLDGDDFNIKGLNDSNLIISAQATFLGVVYQIRVTFRHP